MLQLSIPNDEKYFYLQKKTSQKILLLILINRAPTTK